MAPFTLATLEASRRRSTLVYLTSLDMPVYAVRWILLDVTVLVHYLEI